MSEITPDDVKRLRELLEKYNPRHLPMTYQAETGLGQVLELLTAAANHLPSLLDAYERGRWIPVGESLPRKGVRVLVGKPATDNSPAWVDVACHYERGGMKLWKNHNWHCDEPIGDDSITHWREIRGPEES